MTIVRLARVLTYLVYAFVIAGLFLNALIDWLTQRLLVNHRRRAVAPALDEAPSASALV